MNVHDYNDITIHYNHINMDLLLLNCYLSILQTYLNSSYDPDDKCSVLSVQEFNKMKVSKIIFLHFFQFKTFPVLQLRLFEICCICVFKDTCTYRSAVELKKNVCN